MRRGLILALALVPACSDDDPCEGVSGKCIGISSGASAETVQKAMIEAEPDSTIAFAAGKYNFKVDLSLDVDGVTVKGAGKDETILSFKDQTEGGQGMLVTSDRVTVRDFAIEDTPGDGLKILGAQKITMQNMRVEWTGGPLETNGAYGLYPVQCKDVLIEDSVVKGASDSGIYVGQSERIVVQNNLVSLNVAGIEIENSTGADVHDNEATGNTGGILVFNLPGLDIANGSTTRVYKNNIHENNQDNFAPAGNIVGLVPKGTGIAILAAHKVEIFGNTIHDHDTVNLGMISYTPTMIAIEDTRYDQFPTAIYIHDNDFAGTSMTPTGELGALLITAIAELHAAPYIVPDIVWDGVRDPMRVVGGGNEYAAADKICISEATSQADFMDLNYPTGDQMIPVMDLAAHACTQPALPEIVLQ